MSTTEFHCVNGTCDGKVRLFIKKLGCFEQFHQFQLTNPFAGRRFLVLGSLRCTRSNKLEVTDVGDSRVAAPVKRAARRSLIRSSTG